MWWHSPSSVDWAQWIEHQPVNHRVSSLIPSQGTCLGFGLGPWWGVHERQPHIDVSLCLSPSFPHLERDKIFIENCGDTKHRSRQYSVKQVGRKSVISGNSIRVYTRPQTNSVSSKSKLCLLQRIVQKLAWLKFKGNPECLWGSLDMDKNH